MFQIGNSQTFTQTLAPDSLMRWARYNITGSTLGIAAAVCFPLFVYHAVGYPQGLREIVLFWLSVLIGGALLGVIHAHFQYKCFEPVLTSNLAKRDWMKATVFASTVGWLVVLLPFIFIANRDPRGADPRIIIKLSFDMLMLCAVPVGLFFGSLMGVMQFKLLTKTLENAVLWVIANSVAWTVGMATVYIAATLTDIFMPKILVFIVCGIGSEICGKILALATYFAGRKIGR